jgi:hypothetical protein
VGRERNLAWRGGFRPRQGCTSGGRGALPLPVSLLFQAALVDAAAAILTAVQLSVVRVAVSLVAMQLILD